MSVFLGTHLRIAYTFMYDIRDRLKSSRRSRCHGKGLGLDLHDLMMAVSFKPVSFTPTEPLRHVAVAWGHYSILQLCVKKQIKIIQARD